ncbi:MAG: efflux RND transporter periplasmic adaptor subunit [Treponema sp.]
MKMNKKSLSILIIIIAVAVTLISVFAISATSKKSITNAKRKRAASVPTVRTELAEEQILQDYVLTNGEVESQRAVAVYPSMGGKIAEVNVVLGSHVNKGDVIAKVDPSEPGTRYALSPVEAPIAGSILSIPSKIGTTVTVNSEITMIGDIENLQISAAIPERYVSELKTGLKADISLQSYPDVVFEAFISRVSPVVDKASRTKEVILHFAKKDSRINAGMFAKVKLYTSKYSGEIVVPSDAVVSDDEYSYVFVIDENCVAEKRIVKTGKSVDAKVQILEGLQSGERVIVEGMLSVSDGIKVNDISSERVNQ